MKSDYVVLWDADGVIFNTFDTDKNILWCKTIEADLGISEKMMQALFGADFLLTLQGKKDTRVHIQTCFQKEQVKVPVDDFIAYWLSKDFSLNEEVMKLVNKHQSYLATNQEYLRANHLENRLATQIRKVFASARIGALKADPVFFAYIERDLNLPPDQLYFVDDTLKNVEVAKSRGWNAYHFEGIHSLPEFLLK